MRRAKAGVTTFQIAATYVGTVVGAGFASGQEVLQFFGLFGIAGAFGVLLAGLLFVSFGYIILDIGHKEQARSHLEVIRKAGGPIAQVIDLIVTFFLFGGLTAMIAGSGAIFVEQFGLSFFAGSLFMGIAALVTVLSGLHGVITAISLFVPFLIGSVILLSIATLLSPARAPGALAATLAVNAPVRFWPASAVIYASYNLLTTSAVLAPVGAQSDGRRNLRGALLGGAGLALGALAIHLAVISTLPQSAGFEIPMLYVASRFGRVYASIYSVVLLGEIYTTAVANLYGFTARLLSPGGRGFGLTAFGISALALLASRFGFTAVVRTVYPAAGWAGLVFMAGLLAHFLRGNRKAGAR